MEEEFSKDGANNNPLESISPALREEVGSEIGSLQAQTTFLRRIRTGTTQGLLTNNNTDILIPQVRTMYSGIEHVYNHLQRTLTSNFEKIFARALYNQWLSGDYLTNDQIAQMKEQCQQGDYSEHVRICEEYMLGRSTKFEGEQRTLRGPIRFTNIDKDGDLIANKALVLALGRRVRQELELVHGEVDFPRAFITEALVNAPFIPSIRKDKYREEVDEDPDEVQNDNAVLEQKRHRNYIDDVLRFAEHFDVEKQLQRFEELTDRFPVEWTDEFAPSPLDPFDQQYIGRIYDLADAIRTGNAGLQDVYEALSQSIIRRGHLFTARMVQSDRDYYLKVEQRPVDDNRTFEGIIGYEEQKNVFKRLLELTETGDSILEDIGIIVLAGPPGHGKSHTIEAFLNALPKNSRGLVLKPSGHIKTELNLLRQLAHVHPELHLFSIIEDIDSFAGNRLTSYNTSAFLEFDSVNDEGFPRNLHVIASTNMPGTIDPAVLRPGRTPIMVHYDKPDKLVRHQLAGLYSSKYAVSCAKYSPDQFAVLTDGFSPDEIRSIFWTFRFKGIQEPSQEQFHAEIDSINRRKNSKDYLK